MKTRITPIALLFLPLALSACGERGGIGAGSSTENKVTTSSESKLDASREIKKSTSAKATLNMPATALVASALLGYANAQPKGSHDPHAVAAREILSVIRPSLGWPVACFGCAAQSTWAVKNAARVNFADLVLTQLALSVQGRALADPQAARQAIVTAYLAMTLPRWTRPANRPPRPRKGHSFPTSRERTAFLTGLAAAPTTATARDGRLSKTAWRGLETAYYLDKR
jgi:uncharacterized protein YceK